MSTPANILILDYGIEGKENLNRELFINEIKKEIILYIHSDGYPSNILLWLNDFLKLDGAKERLFDKYILISWLTTYYNITIESKYLNEIATQYKEYLKDQIDLKTYTHNLDNYIFNANDFKNLSDFQGSGIYQFDQIDLNYLYIITPNEYYYKKPYNFFNIYVYDKEFNLIYKINENESKENILNME